MKNIIRSLISVGVLGALGLFSTHSGYAQSPRFYVRGGIGPALTEDTSLKEFNGPADHIRQTRLLLFLFQLISKGHLGGGKSAK